MRFKTYRETQVWIPNPATVRTLERSLTGEGAAPEYRPGSLGARGVER